MALITITGNLQDVTGGNVSSGEVIATLCNYGSNAPYVSGTSILVTPKITAVANGSGVFSFQLYGNDVITPANTFYQLTFANSAGTFITTANYLFTGSTAVNLNSYTPLTTTPTAAVSINVFMQKANNLSDVASVPTALTALGLTAPLFIFSPQGSGSGVGTVINNTTVQGFYINYPVSFTNIMVSSLAADGAHLYDWGIYSSSGNLLAHVGARNLINGNMDLAIVGGGTVVLAPGKYYFAVTGTSSVGLFAQTSPLLSFSGYHAISAPTSGGVLNSTITPPADVWVLGVCFLFALHS